jgi:hypothetical protein
VTQNGIARLFGIENPWPPCGEWAPINASQQECIGCGEVRTIPDDCTSEDHECIGDHLYHYPQQ